MQMALLEEVTLLHLAGVMPKQLGESLSGNSKEPNQLLEAASRYLPLLERFQAHYP